MTIHKCDVCGKKITSKDLALQVGYTWHEFCQKHAAPFLRVLKNYKLLETSEKDS